MPVWARWRETEIHHVDLDAGYTHSHGPAEFAAAAHYPHQAPALVIIDLTYPKPFRHRPSLEDRPPPRLKR